MWREIDKDGVMETSSINMTYLFTTKSLFTLLYLHCIVSRAYIFTGTETLVFETGYLY
jgi:hypothetical protein